MAAPPAVAGEAPRGTGTRPLYRILLVDDNADFVDGIGGLLRAEGHAVQVCHDGLAALEVADGFAPDFAFLDIGLPGLNGYDLARALRQLPALRRTVLVAVTGWGQDKDKQLALDAGFQDHIVKPVGFDQLLSILDAKGGPAA